MRAGHSQGAGKLWVAREYLASGTNKSSIDSSHRHLTPGSRASSQRDLDTLGCT